MTEDRDKSRENTKKSLTSLYQTSTNFAHSFQEERLSLLTFLWNIGAVIFEDYYAQWGYCYYQSVTYSEFIKYRQSYEKP